MRCVCFLDHIIGRTNATPSHSQRVLETLGWEGGGIGCKCDQMRHSTLQNIHKPSVRLGCRTELVQPRIYTTLAENTHTYRAHIIKLYECDTGPHCWAPNARHSNASDNDDNDSSTTNDDHHTRATVEDDDNDDDDGIYVVALRRRRCRRRHAFSDRVIENV